MRADHALNHGAGEVRVDHNIAADSVTVTVTDEGHGFAEGTFTPSNDRRGVAGEDLHGLGLPLARRLVEAMPGRLTISHAGNHPRVEIVLQRNEPASKVTT